MILKVTRWFATVLAIWNGVFLAYEGLWLSPRTVGIDSWLVSTLLLIACFLPIVAAVWAVPRPKQGALVMIAAVGIYCAFCAVRVLGELSKRETLGWDWAPFNMFVIPSTVLAVTLYLTSRGNRRIRNDAV